MYLPGARLICTPLWSKPAIPICESIQLLSCVHNNENIRFFFLRFTFSRYTQNVRKSVARSKNKRIYEFKKKRHRVFPKHNNYVNACSLPIHFLLQLFSCKIFFFLNESNHCIDRIIMIIMCYDACSWA